MKGHATDDHVNQGITTHIDLEHNATADDQADAAMSTYPAHVRYYSDTYSLRQRRH